MELLNDVIAADNHPVHVGFDYLKLMDRTFEKFRGVSICLTVVRNILRVQMLKVIPECENQFI